MSKITGWYVPHILQLCKRGLLKTLLLIMKVLWRQRKEFLLYKHVAQFLFQRRNSWGTNRSWTLPDSRHMGTRPPKTFLFFSNENLNSDKLNEENHYRTTFLGRWVLLRQGCSLLQYHTGFGLLYLAGQGKEELNDPEKRGKDRNKRNTKVGGISRNF